MEVKVKHITKLCRAKDCGAKAFVQVVVVDDAETQKQIDTKARAKLTKTLREQHEEGLHD